MTDSCSYFAAYEVTKKALTPAGSSPTELNLSAIILAGGTAGVAMWALAIPPDVSSHDSGGLDAADEIQGREIQNSVSTYGDIQWLFRLCSEDYCTRRSGCSVEGLWACYDTGMYHPTLSFLFHRLTQTWTGISSKCGNIRE